MAVARPHKPYVRLNREQRQEVVRRVRLCKANTMKRIAAEMQVNPATVWRIFTEETGW